MGSRADDRRKIVEYLGRQLVGPVGGDDEVLLEEPAGRYLTAILYPQEQEPSPGEESRSAVDPSEESDEQGGQIGEEVDEDPLTLAGQHKPSSAGLSFMISDWAPIVVEVEFARYVADGGTPRRWARRPVRLVGDDALRLVPPGPADRRRTLHLPFLDGRASIDAVWRPRENGGAIVTVSLVNRSRASTRAEDAAGCLLQVVLRARPGTGTIRAYPNAPHLYGDDEAQELELLYRTAPTYAVGHGVAAAWSGDGRETPEWVHTSYVPAHVVPGISFSVPGHEKILDLAMLARFESAEAMELVGALDAFVDSYDGWAEQLRSRLDTGDVPSHLHPAAGRLLHDVDEARRRMRSGVRLLESDRTVRRAFALANRAMHRQIVHRGKDLAGEPHETSDPPVVNPDYPENTHFWRPFQLGFLLLTLHGAAIDDSPDREIVDLIWFPTGGGKTEAYLGLTAFIIMLRRLRDRDEAAGTTVITRYTLRLLTTQQFQRAATLICSCELLRREDPAALGHEPISIGLWVGNDNTPKDYREARQLLERLQASETVDTSFQIELCPWCGTRIVPGERSVDHRWGVVATNSAFLVRCPNEGCSFHDRLPISSVDEDLYEHPPTFLVGTVDKFARTVWDPRSGAFFGSGDHPGPSLVIQDEFHLISGPLGTMVGIYEAAFDVLMSHNGARPKFVASTATVRRAQEQTKGVFGREVALFPPAGLEADDSYFVRTDREAPGRLYLGMMPQGHTPLTALVHLAAALLQSPVDVELTPDGADPYRTLVVYHNSLRELGKTVTLAHDDIPARVKVIAVDENRLRPLTDDDVVELTSNVPARDIPKVLERLGRSHDEPDPVSLAASTNMLSVGVDVPRLGLMVIVGQPKTTAEYIQASSRVGRTHPGLVVTLYSPSKPRDRSHYEAFMADHTKLYRSVEPTSVTPFSLPARTRALHAGLVILARHARGWSGELDAAAFDGDDADMTQLIDQLTERARAADASEYEKVREDLRRLAGEWTTRALGLATAQPGLTYAPRGSKNPGPALLRHYDQKAEAWPTLDSMRNVDVMVNLRIRGEK
ncbi:helicase-related protein [Parafrankia sp. EUN1f]|uniref:helicase-related protein n=1 Tax=Parafrankia sp. EUN1f TaxID=102897 RepID=UPI0001C44E58|nr:helicase-related protein [Parafrankia sp. EUN1f]EFC83348.1 helicase domain protein [Parafrankia sp. EUN1f]